MTLQEQYELMKRLSTQTHFCASLKCNTCPLQVITMDGADCQMRQLHYRFPQKENSPLGSHEYCGLEAKRLKKLLVLQEIVK